MTNGCAPDVYGKQELPNDVGELRAALQEKTQHMKQLEHRLAHLQAWMEAQASQMQADNPATVKNARRLYIGGLPEGTTDVSMWLGCSSSLTAAATAAGGTSSRQLPRGET
jgi:hypothetical protein